MRAPNRSAFDPESTYNALCALENEERGAAILEAKSWDESAMEALCDVPGSDDLWNYLRLLQMCDTPPGAEFRAIIHDTAELAEREPTLMDYTERADLAPTWSACIDTIEGPVMYRGLSILGGQTGVGKSKLASRAAILRAGLDPNTTVIYLCAELDLPTCVLYAEQITGLDGPTFVERFPNFRPIEIPAGCTFERMVRAVYREIPENCTRVVIVVDTLNTVVEKIQQEGGDGYFRLMRRMGIWMLESRMRSGGRIAWLAVSELNRDDQVLGMKLDKWSDFVLRFKRGDTKNQVVVDVLKGRYSGSEALGTYMLNWRTCELEKC